MKDPIKNTFEGWAKMVLDEHSIAHDPDKIESLTKLFLLARYLHFPVDTRRQQIEDSLTRQNQTASEHLRD